MDGTFWVLASIAMSDVARLDSICLNDLNEGHS